MAQQVTSEQLLQNIQQYAQNPTALMRTMMLALEQSSDGVYYLVDPSNPFVFLQESACLLATAQITGARVIARELYASLAETPDELYRHMSDRDHLDRFASPAETTVEFWLSLDEVVTKAVSPPNNTDALAVRRLVIARNTRIMGGGYPLTMQYPIEIRVLPNGAINVVFDTTFKSPFWQPATNKIRWNIRSITGRKYLVMEIPVWQMDCNTQINSLNAVTGFNKTFTYQNRYYYTRAFVKRESDLGWMEIRTTHSDQTYDPNYPTAVLKVDTVNRLLGVVIPQIYFNNGTIMSQLRLDIYTTNGKVELSLKNYDPSSYSARFIDLDDQSSSRYRAPFDTFSDFKIRSTDVITGGSDGMSFDTLRDRVVTNALDSPLVPISLGGLESALDRNGFEMILNVDNITDREVLASRVLPSPSSGVTGSNVGVRVGTVLTRLQEWQLNDGIADNGARMTVKPNALFDFQDGVLKLVPTSVVNSLKAMTTLDYLAYTVNQHHYAFTPFYYVLDTQNETFGIRPYRLDSPVLLSQYFIRENEKAAVGVSSSSANIEPAPTGDGWYVLVGVDTTDNDLWKAFDEIDKVVQLSYIDAVTGTRHIYHGEQITAIDPATGKPVDGKYVYRFHLTTHFDIDPAHRLRLSGLNSGLINLESDMDLVFIIKNWIPTSPTDGSPLISYNTEIDQLVDPLADPNNVAGDVYLGVSHESMRIHLGDYLENLWRRSRSIVGYMEYALNTLPTTYKNWPKTVYTVDGSGNINMSYNGITGALEYEVLHYAGDPVIPTPITLTDTAAALVGDTVISFDTTILDLDPTVRYAFTLWGAGVNGWSLCGTIISSTAGSVTLSVPVDTAIGAGAKFVYGVQQPLAVFGEPVLDPAGNPIPISERPMGMQREFDLLLLDGRYYFATDERSLNDLAEAVDYFTEWMEGELADIATRLLERTNLFFYPTVTQGSIAAVGTGAQALYIEAEQALTITYYLTDDRFNNEDLRAKLEKVTATIVANTLTNRVVSRTLIERRLKDSGGDDVVSVEVVGFNPNSSQTLLFKDPLTRPTVAKRLTLSAAGTLVVQDDVQVIFDRYEADR